MTKRGVLNLFIILLVLAGLVAGTVFAVRYVSVHKPIQELRTHSRDYEGKMVTISGTVAEAVGIGGVGTYLVDDGTGQIWVYTSKGVPSTGEQVKVRGRLNTAFVFRGNRCMAIIEGEED